MRFPPLSVIATWPNPNYVNPQTRGPGMLIVELIFMPTALMCVSLRLWVRIRKLRNVWWDDWLMAGAAVFATGVTISVILAAQLYGWDKHVWDLKPAQEIQGRQVSIAAQTLFVFASGLSKLSILFSYLRIATPGSKFRWFVWAVIALVAAYNVIFVIVLWCNCKPAWKYWDLFATNRDCIPEAPPLMAHAVLTVLTDVMMYVLPMPTLFQLRLPLLQRIGLICLFGAGSVVIIAGILRTYWVHYVEYETYDVTWAGFYVWIWTAVEVNLGVICGCVPSLKVLVWCSKSRKGTYGTPGSNRTIGSAPVGKMRSEITETELDTELDFELAKTLSRMEGDDSFSIIVQDPEELSRNHSLYEADNGTFLSEESLGLPRGEEEDDIRHDSRHKY